MIYSGSLPVRSKLQLLGLGKMGEQAVSLSEGDTEVAYVTSAHMSVSELSHVAAREAEKYIPQLVNHVPHSNWRALLPKGRMGERIAGRICRLYHRTCPWTWPRFCLWLLSLISGIHSVLLQDTEQEKCLSMALC